MLNLQRVDMVRCVGLSTDHVLSVRILPMAGLDQCYRAQEFQKLWRIRETACSSGASSNRFIYDGMTEAKRRREGGRGG
jgi:hypothetical protein